MIKSKVTKAWIMGMCITAISSGTVFANSDDMAFNRASSIEVETENYLVQKHREIDQYIFEKNAKEIAEKGFTVTHTGPMGDYIEIGITPYAEEHAAYLYEIFGRELVKVAKGEQAYLLKLPADSSDSEAGSREDNLPIENRVIMDQGIRIQVNDEWVETDVASFIENSRTLVPLRGVMEKLGTTVAWDAEKQAVKVLAEDMDIVLTIGQDTATITRKVDGIQSVETVQLEVPAKLVEGRTFIPGRFVAKSLGAIVGWDDSNRIVTIKTDGNREQPAGKKPAPAEIGESLEAMGKAIPIDEIKEMKLYSLMQEEIKTYTPDEINNLINLLNINPTHKGVYPLMLAGNSISIVLKDETNIQLTSYGFEEHVLVNGQVDGEQISYCIVSPEIGRILLNKTE
ncbi:copper amine oxidase N-terminal domain-containing protein [Geosporobacter ferrireducens]|uniref:copper amine oxidase N-terminal domain-containing protein n=1 Tax=Geosporobacter ferrireducens TaxID=1424294 RepID=UPI00139C4B9C|nr:copper amine oxidase N-terminal domain-containing protein [Geosporobacter ferrireducens]MTI54299.1 copper amine oxidase N-terminal domain-containing protein [Geosporobacter ferrireducens]